MGVHVVGMHLICVNLVSVYIDSNHVVVEMYWVLGKTSRSPTVGGLKDSDLAPAEAGDFPVARRESCKSTIRQDSVQNVAPKFSLCTGWS
jgi:hypothetical protein